MPNFCHRCLILGPDIFFGQAHPFCSEAEAPRKEGRLRVSILKDVSAAVSDRK